MVLPVIPDRSYGMDDVLCIGLEGRCDHGIPVMAVADFIACLLEFFLPCCAEDRTADTAAFLQGTVGRIDHDIRAAVGDALLENLNPAHASFLTREHPCGRNSKLPSVIEMVCLFLLHGRLIGCIALLTEMAQFLTVFPEAYC